MAFATIVGKHILIINGFLNKELDMVIRLTKKTVPFEQAEIAKNFG
jgi:hypothetical protein